MSELIKFNNIFKSVFNVNDEDLNDEFSIDSVDNWDSITQLTLVTDIEDEFDLMFDTEDILAFRSYKDGKKIMEKYDISL